MLLKYTVKFETRQYCRVVFKSSNNNNNKVYGSDGFPENMIKY